ncbi:Nif11-like leader peptide family natural product precursor [Nostoc sp. FACHB-87]|uniref:Nif11-like leader peptide family natural product precursor n=1 Tax=Nostocales TaxID=1161 RepID=UPI001685C80D|nr:MULTISPECIES: Nif11-like leader peptide family natural product precursor [Nostocales]MBD2299685.1 Nif11-like leader peptide family natural product precursor [Nostoc sp. FACHB-190]MBD2457467.1 Nif11-like leader peptide family natural product precursor [Nostoc sp. FACHB-87]MBD2477565.1 Nif11-like leader peptide family natural product precursor [Anabaena sp. FACHB-83]MBD2489592.1 Nif11-like leader peptide family natural product precursor [Aulosira sp. FACHB-615]
MSIQDAQAFYSRMKTDDAFLDQVENAASPENRLEIIQSAGYDFSAEEFNTVLAQNAQPEAGELSEAELLQVSGGIRFASPGLVRPLYGVGIPPRNYWRPRK